MKKEEETSEKIPDKKEENNLVKKRKPFKILIVLIAALILIDIVSIYFYFNPSLNFSTNKDAEKSLENTCKDGTAYSSCSKNKPYFCYNGELLKKAFTCGCPKGYKINFQDCESI